MRTYITSGIVLIVLAAIFIFASNSAEHKTVTKDLTAIEEQSALVTSSGSNLNVGKVQNLTWAKAKYPSDYVSIRLLKKIDADPVRYDLVRVISSKTANTGSMKWTPTDTDVGTNLLIEISCVSSTNACSAGYQPIGSVNEN